MLSEHIKLALDSIKAARFRNFLTMIGIVIGVTGVITILSLGEGIKQQISSRSQQIGSDLITVRPGQLVDRDAQGKVNGINVLSFLSSSKLDDKDLQSIRQNQSIETVVPMSIINGVPSIGNKQFKEGFIMATGEAMPQVIGQEIEFGNFFEGDSSDRRTAVIGQGVAEKLFEENVPVGKSLQIRGQEFVVAGVYEKFPTRPLNPEADFNNGVYISYSAAQAIAGQDLTIYEILARPKNKDRPAVDQAIGSISSSLKANHAGQEDFSVLRQEDVVLAADSLLKLVTKSVAVMAGLTLFIGGIGIMNAMLVSVTERTREIGIRKAVGATNRQIQLQFLIEAVAISTLGAITGVVLSGAINLGFRILTSLQPVITWQSVVGVTLVSVVIGIIFGLIPAIKASRKDPIEALRLS